jgi:hypothetical protein
MAGQPWPDLAPWKAPWGVCRRGGEGEGEEGKGDTAGVQLGGAMGRGTAAGGGLRLWAPMFSCVMYVRKKKRRRKERRKRKGRKRKKYRKFSKLEIFLGEK